MPNVITRTAPYQTTISASTSEVNLVTTTMPTNLLTSGSGARMDLMGKIVANATAPSIVLRGKMTGASTETVWASTISPSSGSTSYFDLSYRMQASSTATQEHWASLPSSTSTIVGQSTENYNQSLTWGVTGQISSTGVSVTLISGTIELLRSDLATRTVSSFSASISAAASIDDTIFHGYLQADVTAVSSNAAALTVT